MSLTAGTIPHLVDYGPARGPRLYGASIQWFHAEQEEWVTIQLADVEQAFARMRERGVTQYREGDVLKDVPPAPAPSLVGGDDCEDLSHVLSAPAPSATPARSP